MKNYEAGNKIEDTKIEVVKLLNKGDRILIIPKLIKTVTKKDGDKADILVYEEAMTGTIFQMWISAGLKYHMNTFEKCIGLGKAIFIVHSGEVKGVKFTYAKFDVFEALEVNTDGEPLPF